MFGRRMPIRWRLTLFYTALVALLLTLFSIYLYTTLTQALSSEIDRTLSDRAQQLSETSSVERFSGLVNIPVDAFSDADTFVQVTTLSDQKPILRSKNMGDNLVLPLPPSIGTIQRNGTSQYDSIAIGGTPLRMYSVPVVLIDGRPQLLIQVAQTTRELDQTTNSLNRILIAGIIVAIVISLFAGHFLSGRGLRPVERVTRAALEIGAARDFKSRVPYEGADDEVGRLAATFNTMLQELEEAYADVANALAAQRRFVADASHELRTPLTAIRGNAELLQRIPNMNPDDLKESIDEMAREAQRMSRLINNLLALARADAGLQMQKTVFPLPQLLEEVVNQARHLSSEVPVYLGPPSDVSLYADRDYVKQLLLILLDNALKYTRPPGWVSISTVATSNTVTISVEDTGVGIAPEHLSHIFERFYRADSSRSSAGTGLGLSIGQWIAEQHGANISVTSQLGQGSVFNVTFPLPVEAPMPLPTSRPPTPPTPSVGTELAPDLGQGLSET